MLQCALLSFTAGALAGNGSPHFVKGITKERFPSVFGSAPEVNFVLGWASFVLAGLSTYEAHVARHSVVAGTCEAAGLLVAGLFHSSIGAFGRRDPAAGGSR
jgi:hypothetical protein